MFPLVGQQAPKIIANCVLPNGEIVKNYDFFQASENKYRLVFFYPLDFTFVCPSELIALHKRMKEFDAINTSVLAVSIDSEHTHARWRNTPINVGGIGPVDFTLAADPTHTICKDYACQSPEGMSYRATYIIDPEGCIRSMQINDKPVGRNIDEYIRLIQALQFHAQHGEVCPAGWTEGQTAMKENSQGVAEYLSKHQESL